jgi:type II secretion system protein N
LEEEADMATSRKGKKGWFVLFYIFYGAALTAVLLYWRFPSGTVARYVKYSIEKALPGKSAHVKDAYPFLGPGLVLEGLVVATKGGGDLLALDKAWIRPEMLSLLRGERVFHIEAAGMGGKVKARVLFQEEGKGLRAEMEMEGIRLEALPALYEATGRSFTGILSGTIEVLSDGSLLSSRAKARLKLKDAAVGLIQPLLGIKELSFSEASVGAEMEKGRVNLGQAEFKGKQFSGTVTGSVLLAMPVKESSIDLKGAVEPQPALLSGGDVPSEAKAGMMQLAKKGRIGFSLRGKAGAPSVRFL